MNKRLIALGLALAGALALSYSFARHGADDPGGHGGHGADDPPGHTLIVPGGSAASFIIARRGRGADDPAGHDRRGHGADDPPNHG